MAKFSIWEDEGRSITLRQGTDPDPTDVIPVLIKTFDAPTWAAATQIRNDHYGWGKHVPVDECEELEVDDA